MHGCNGINVDDLGVETNKLLLLLAEKRFNYRLNEIERVRSHMSDESARAARLAANEAFQKAVKELL